jgi:hypothetical protein
MDVSLLIILTFCQIFLYKYYGPKIHRGELILKFTTLENSKVIIDKSDYKIDGSVDRTQGYTNITYYKKTVYNVFCVHVVALKQVLCSDTMYKNITHSIYLQFKAGFYITKYKYRCMVPVFAAIGERLELK